MSVVFPEFCEHTHTHTRAQYDYHTLPPTLRGEGKNQLKNIINIVLALFLTHQETYNSHGELNSKKYK